MPVPLMRRILVLDDDEVVRSLLEVLLGMEHYEFTGAGSGDEALRLLPGEPAFDVVLTDLHMPGQQGEALIRDLRGAMDSRTLLVGISASAPPESTRLLLDGFVPKPFETHRLAQVILAAQQDRAGGSSSSGQRREFVFAEEPVAEVALDESIFNALARSIPLGQLGELYRMTLADIDKRLSRIQTAANAGDLGTAQREAHTIKGSCGFVGATELQTLAASIEDGSTFDLAALAEIPSACLRLRRMLESKLQAA